MAADTLVTFGDTALPQRYEANSKIFKIDTPVGISYVGMAGTVAHFPALRKAMVSLPKADLKLSAKDEVYDTFLKLHPLLKETFFCKPRKTTMTRMSRCSSRSSLPMQAVFTACTATARFLSSRNFGASVLAAVLHWARCMPFGAQPKPPKKWPLPA